MTTENARMPSRRERQHTSDALRSFTLALVVALTLSTALSVRGMTFNQCEFSCSAPSNRGRCASDGACVCFSGWSGVACDLPTPGLSKESRFDGVRAYEYNTAGTANKENYVRDVIYDSKKDVMYVYGSDENGNPRVFEVDPKYPTSFTAASVTSRGWGPANGPRRASTTKPVALVVEAEFCGTSISVTCTRKHPRDYGSIDSVVSRGWYAAYSKLALDVSGDATGVYAPINMWHSTITNRYKFRIVKYVGTACSNTSSLWESCMLGSASSGQHAMNFEKDGYILDAMGTDPGSGLVVFKATHEDGASPGILGMLSSALISRGEVAVQPSLLASRCPECASAPDNLRLETSITHKGAGINYVIFAGSALLDATNKIYYPALYKVNTAPSSLSGDGIEMYLDTTTVKVLDTCEGQLDSRQGRFSTFTAMTKHNGKGYVGTSGRDSDCLGCPRRAACIFMFDLDFAEGASPMAVIALDGALGERDVTSATVQPAATGLDKTYMYWTVRSRDGEPSRIVKIEIGGSNTLSTCITNCFRRVASIEESFPYGGISYMPSTGGIFAVSSAPNTTYLIYSTVVLSSVSPKYVSSETSGTSIRVLGSGFYARNLTAGQSSSIACRFGHTLSGNDGFSITSWSHATFVSSTELKCTAPAAVYSNSTALGYSEVQISFDGFPSISSDPTNIWKSSMWTSGNLYMLYHDPVVIVETKIGVAAAEVLYTGEDAGGSPVMLHVFGGPFINSLNLTCRFAANDTSVTAASFVSESEITCPICLIVDGRCNNPQGRPVPWLSNGVPSDVTVEISLNGIDYSASTGILKLYGPPNGVKLLSSSPTYRAYKANAAFSLNPFSVGLIDANGLYIPNDMGQGGSRGFTIKAVLHGPSAVAIIPSTASERTTEGVATFRLELDAVPSAGEYRITFIGTDCTGTICADDLAVNGYAYFSVEPGSSSGLDVRPASATGVYVTDNGLFPTDVVALSGSETMNVGHVTVSVVDVAKNELGSLSTVDVSVTASLVVGSIDGEGEHRARVQGARLSGTLTKICTLGQVTFSDLVLKAASNSGTRAVGSTSDIVYGGSTRGDFGEASKYIIQFKAVINGAPVVAHSVLRIDIGEPAYLRINGTYSMITTYRDAPKQPVGEIIIGAYDGGNNFVGTAERAPREVRVDASAGVALAGSLVLSRAADTGVWRFSDITVVSPSIVDFELKFTSADLKPVIQVVRILSGNAGYKLMSNTSSLSTVVAASSLLLSPFAVEVYDWLDTPMGSGDKHSTGDDFAPNRRMFVTCETLMLSGTTEVFTNGTGQAYISALVAIRPKSGTHTIVVREHDADVHGEVRAGRLQSTSVVVTITSGAVSGFKLSSSAQLHYTSSFSESLQPSEILAYSAGDTIPLGDLQIVPVDIAGNEAPTGTLPAGVLLTASIDDSNRELYSYILGANKTGMARQPVLTVYPDTSVFPRNGSLTQTTSSAGVATFSGLHLVRPKSGIYNLTFASHASSYTSASVGLTITPGRSQHVGLLPYCNMSTTNASLCDTSTNCTCNSYRAASDVPLHPVSVYILDGALNPVGNLETKSCENCPERLVHLSPKNITLCRNIELGNSCECAGLASLNSKLHDKVCSSVVTITTTPHSGLAYFDGLFIAAPKMGTYAVEVYSPGLTSVEYYLSIFLGIAESFALDIEQASGKFASQVQTAITNATNPLVGRLYDGGKNFMSSAAHGEQIFVSCNTATLAPYPQGNSPVIGGSNYAVSCGSALSCQSQNATAGIVKFKNLVLLAPAAGTHEILFTMNGKQMASYKVTIELGPASQFKVANSPSTTYQAAASITIGLIEIAIADSAGNLLGTANTNPYLIKTDIIGPRHTFRNTTGRSKTIGSSSGSVLFSNLIIESPEVGNYILIFSCDGCAAIGRDVAPMRFAFSVSIGFPSALAVATSYTLPSTGETLAKQIIYTTAQEVLLRPFVVQVVDAALNPLNLNYEIAVTTTAVSVGACTSEVKMSYTPRSVIAGVAIFDDIKVKRPCTGSYDLTFSTTGLASVSVRLTYNTGYPSSIDVCAVNSFVRVESGLCKDNTAYTAAFNMIIRSFSAQMTDPGGTHVGASWDSEPRNVTVELDSFTPDTHQPAAAFEPMLLADWKGSLLAVNGAVGWCNNTVDSNPRNVIIRDPITGVSTYQTQYSNPAAEYCREMSYSGVAPGTHYNVGLKIDQARAGIYRLRFSSYCGPDRCPGALYPTLEPDLLQFTVTPGSPSALKMMNAPPFVNENDFALVPAPVIALVDAVGNVCTQVSTLLTVSVTPTLTSLLGTDAQMVNGIATFDNIRLVGQRGTEYLLTFTATTYGFSISPERPTTVMNCSAVKPNSELHSGECACVPGFTSDVSGRSGYTADLDTLYIERNISLYKATTGSKEWISALHPYGVCVPCSNGFFKAAHGADPCVSCPERMDTARSDGSLRNPYESSAGTLLLGSLGHAVKDACHCISQTHSPFLSYYRKLPLEDYSCGDCPVGGECDGGVAERIKALPGYSRFRRTSIKFRECPVAEACLGGVNSTCLDGGYTGSRCAACSKGYAYHSIKEAYPPRCYDCGSGPYAVMNAPILAVNFIWFFVLVWLIRQFNLRRESQSVNLVKSFVTYLQMTALAKNLNLNWPDSVKQFLLLAQKLSLLDIRSSSFKCLLDWNFYVTLAFHELLPLFVLASLFIYFLVLKGIEDLKEETAEARSKVYKMKSRKSDESAEDENEIKRSSGAKETKAKDKDSKVLEETWRVTGYDKVVSWFVVALWLLYPTLIQFLIEFTQCTGSPGDEDRHFVSDYNLRCSGGLYAGLWVVVALLLILYGLGVPMLLLYMLNGEDITRSHTSVTVQYRFGLLFKGLDIKNVWWWEWVIFIRKLLLIIAVIALEQNEVFGGYCANCLLQIFFLLHITAKPYASVEHGRIETGGLLSTMTTFTGGLIFAQSNTSKNAGNVNTLVLIITVAFFLAHSWTWYNFARTLRALLKTESEKAVITRAVRDLELENEIVDHFDGKRDAGVKQQEALAKEQERIHLQSLIGERLPFADDDLLDNIKQDSTLAIRAEHKELSSKLSGLREKWKERASEREERHVALDERHLSALSRRTTSSSRKPGESVGK